MTVTKVALVGAGVGVVATLVFGILELKAESDYDKEIRARGDRMTSRRRAGHTRC